MPEEDWEFEPMLDLLVQGRRAASRTSCQSVESYDQRKMARFKVERSEMHEADAIGTNDQREGNSSYKYRHRTRLADHDAECTL